MFVNCFFLLNYDHVTYLIILLFPQLLNLNSFCNIEIFGPGYFVIALDIPLCYLKPCYVLKLVEPFVHAFFWYYRLFDVAKGGERLM